MRFILMVLVAISLAGAATAEADRPQPPDQSFGIFRDGSRIGSRTTRFRHDGDDLVVETATDIKVKIAFITAYKRTERQKEVWRGGRLMALTSTMDIDGDEYRVELARGTNGLETVGEKRGITIPEGALPATYWNPATASATALIDIKQGNVLKIETRRLGQEPIPVRGVDIQAMKYELTGDRNLTLWYGPDGSLVRLQLTARDGSDIVIRRSKAD
jgi:hypothetical protein